MVPTLSTVGGIRTGKAHGRVSCEFLWRRPVEFLGYGKWYGVGKASIFLVSDVQSATPFDRIDTYLCRELN